MDCEAEAPYDDQIAYCILAKGHLSRWHEGVVVTQCPECRRRECHTESCSAPLEPLPYPEYVHWDGPATPMPALDPWDRIVADRWQQLIDEAEPAGDGQVSIDRGAMVAVQLLYGPPDGFRSFLDDAEEWGRDLVRACDIPTTTTTRT